MQNLTYFHPVGLLYGEPARQAISDGIAGKLAGGAIGFAAVRLMTRHETGCLAETRNFSDLNQSQEQVVARALERLTSVRASIAGLSLEAPKIMGVVNVTPDSFSDGGLYNRADRAVSHAARLISEGADIIDIGGESTRPGAEEVETPEELKRILPVIKGLKGCGAKLSIDTRKAAVMAAAHRAGVHMINDVSAFTYDETSIEVAAASNLPIVLMHARGNPKTMQDEPSYREVLLDVYDYLAERIEACETVGIPRDRIIADPGIGFGKRLDHNLSLFNGLSLFHGLGVPLMLGASRKAFIGGLTGVAEPREREPGSLAAALAGLAQGVHFVRVHQVAEMVQARTVWQAIAFGKKQVETKG